ncbi:MAG: YdeI/OmpD-associated family protein [Bacteroidota bacterium]
MKPLVNKNYKLEKFPGKGGWTFARIPEVLQDKHSPFGWVKVRVIIDGYEIKKYRLMPMGDGRLFLPVRSDIRKKIGKKEGDIVNVILYRDDEPFEVPEELLLCLRDEPSALKFFNSLPEGERSSYINWIYSTKKEQTKVERLAVVINRLMEKKKFSNKLKNVSAS